MAREELISSVFVDSDIFIALNDCSESNHTKAEKAAQVLFDKKIRLVTATNVLLETATLLSQRISHDKAISFLRELRSSEMLIEHPKVETILHAEQIFIRQTSKNVSYSDCVSFAIMRESGINVAFSFDRDFKKNGFSLFPII